MMTYKLDKNFSSPALSGSKNKKNSKVRNYPLTDLRNLPIS